MGAVLLVLFGMGFACVSGYLARSPLAPSESVAALIDFSPAFALRCPDVSAFWEELRSQPRYEELRGEGAFSGTIFARAAERIDRRGRVLGLSVVDVFDLAGDEVVAAVVPTPGGTAVLFASRVRTAGNLALGIYASLKGCEALQTSVGEWWMVLDRGAGVGWTKVGDVLVASNSAALLARFVAAARSGRRRGVELMAALSGGDAPQVAVAVRPLLGAWLGGARAAKLPKVCVVSVRVGMRKGPAPARAASGAGGDAGQFRELACAHMPDDTCAGLVLRRRPEELWKLVLGALPELAREDVIRYAEDELCAVLDVDDFEKGVLGRMTGDFALAMSHKADPWLSLAGGRGAPTVALVLRMAADEAFERRLPYVLVQAAEKIKESDERLRAEVSKVRHRGRVIHTIRVTRAAKGGAARSATAGFFLARADGRDAKSPGDSLIVASTSVDWLRRAIDAREGEGGLRGQEWFGGMLRAAAPGSSVFGFVHGRRLGRVGGRVGAAAPGGERGARWDTAARWLQLLGGFVLDGDIGEDGTIRAVLRISGRRLGAP